VLVVVVEVASVLLAELTVEAVVEAVVVPMLDG